MYSTSPLPSSLAPQQTPYLSSVDLSLHYLSNPPPFPALLPPFPGYQIPPKGQLQLVISNPTGTGVKVFLIPYDCEGMSAGERMVLRLKEYEEDEVLRGSVLAHICSPAPHQLSPTGGTISSHSTPTKKKRDAVVGGASFSPVSPTTLPTPPPPQQKYYLHSTLRLVFSPLTPSRPVSSSPSSSKSLHRTLIDLGSPSLGPSRFLPFDTDPDLLLYLAARKARRHAVRRDLLPANSSISSPKPGIPAEESRGRASRSRGSGRERGEGGGEGLILSFGKRREVVGRRKGEGGMTVIGNEKGEREESELSRKMRGMGMVGR